MDVILYSFRAITPILLLILLGYLLRRIRLINKNFVDFGNTLLYTVLLPQADSALPPASGASARKPRFSDNMSESFIRTSGAL